MEYEIIIDFCPAYELIVSLYAFSQGKKHKTIDLGKKWVNSVMKILPSEFIGEIKESESIIREMGLDLLVASCPGDRSATQFIEWFKSLSTEKIKFLISDYFETVPEDLSERKEKMISILTKWNEYFFSTVDQTIINNLAMDKEKKLELKKSMSPENLFELATNGIHQLATPDLKKVRLIPQYHLSPTNNSIHYKNHITCFYHCDAKPVPDGLPSQPLLRLTQCLGDESRLMILRYVSEGPKEFQDLVNFTGLVKSTVHHHLVALRAAGLLQIEASGRNTKYRLRRGGIEKLNELLKTYLNFYVEDDIDE